MRFLFKIINYIFLSTFGIFISDIYGLKEIILQIEYYWMNYVHFIHENKIYKILVKIFNVVNDENKSNVIENKSEVIENKSEEIEDKSKVIKSKIIESEFPSSGRTFQEEKIIHDKSSTGDVKENWFEINKYLIGLSILCLTLTLSYIYWDSIWELFKNVKPDDDDGSTISENPIFIERQEEYYHYFKELYDLEEIKDQNKVKNIEYSDVESTKWEDSPTTPKASSSKLPETHGVMLPISKK
nr:hypothetical protein [Russula sp.]